MVSRKTNENTERRNRNEQKTKYGKTESGGSSETGNMLWHYWAVGTKLTNEINHFTSE